MLELGLIFKLLVLGLVFSKLYDLSDFLVFTTVAWLTAATCRYRFTMKQGPTAKKY